MAKPHPALYDLAAGRRVPHLDDPREFLRSAFEQRMAGLLWTEVEAERVDLPVQLQRALAGLSLRTRAHHQRLWRTLDEVCARLAERGIAVASAKGVTSEIRWYSHMGDRPCADLDLLLSPAQVHRASEAVAALQPDHPLLHAVDDLTASGALQSVDVSYEGIDIDLHFDILKLGVPLRHNDTIWDRTVDVRSPGGAAVRALDAETSLVLFLLHLLKDRFAFLLGYVDIVRIIERSDVDWDFVEDFLESDGLTPPAQHAMNAVCETLGVSNPLARRVHGWRGAATRVLWPASMRLGGVVGRLTHHRRQFLLPFLMPGHERAGARALLRLAVPPASLIDYHHPDTAGPVPWRLAVGRVRRARERRQAIRALETDRGQPAPNADAAVTDAIATHRFKRIPPGVGHVLTPVSSRPAASAAIAMYSASRGRALLAQRIGLAAVRFAGPRVLPGRARPWSAPDSWHALAERLSMELGEFHDAVIYERSQPDRAGFAVLLLRDGRPAAFVKLQPSSGSQLVREADALEAMRRSGPTSFSVPALLGTGTAASWSFVALEPFPVALHRPPDAPPLDLITKEICTGLGELPKDTATPSHWTPMHGDLTPWNLRQFAGGRRVLIDWESAGWGPPGADVVLYRATAAALGDEPDDLGDFPEAVEFWRRRLTADSATQRDQRLRRGVLRRLPPL